MKKATASKEPKKKKSDEYKVSVKILGVTYDATGETAVDAISKLTPKNCKGRGILVIEKGDVRKEKILMPITAYRLFNTTGLSRQIALKNISTLFSGI